MKNPIRIFTVPGILTFSLLAGLLAAFLVPAQASAAPQAAAINPASQYVLYSREDGTSWLKDAGGDRMILDGKGARLSPDGRYLVVRRWDTLDGDLYLYDLETKQEKLIFNNLNDYIVGFSWSSDGSRIYFDYSCVIYAVNPDGSNLQVIIENWPPDANPTWNNCYNDAPDINPVDGRLAWHSEKYGIGLSMGDGQNRHWLFNTTPGDWNPRWSPDGEWIAFQRAGDLYKIRPDGTSLTRLSNFSAPNSLSWWNGAWEAGGNWLLSSASVNGVYRIYAIAANGSGKMALLYTVPGTAPMYVGSSGSWDFHFIYLPSVMRQGK